MHTAAVTAGTIGTTLCFPDTVRLSTGVLLDTHARSRCVLRNALKNCTSLVLNTIGIHFHNSTNSRCTDFIVGSCDTGCSVLAYVCTYTVGAALLDHATPTTAGC
jgi:hypothetical protein